MFLPESKFFSAFYRDMSNNNLEAIRTATLGALAQLTEL